MPSQTSLKVFLLGNSQFCQTDNESDHHTFFARLLQEPKRDDVWISRGSNHWYSFHLAKKNRIFSNRLTEHHVNAQLSLEHPQSKESRLSCISRSEFLASASPLSFEFHKTSHNAWCIWTGPKAVKLQQPVPHSPCWPRNL